MFDLFFTTTVFRSFFSFHKLFLGFAGVLFIGFLGELSAVQAQVVINEIAWMGTDASAYDEWIELYNPTDQAVDITGWQLLTTDGEPRIDLQGVIAADGFFVLERTDDTTLSVASQQIYTGSLSNTGEKFWLYDLAGNLIDQTPATPWVAGTNTQPKKSMERINPFLAGDTADNWASYQYDTASVQDAKSNQVLGSPGLYNSVSPPKPQPTQKFVPTDFFVSWLKVSPATIGSHKEWLSLVVRSSQAVDLTDWSLRQGKTTKKISQIPSLAWNESHFPTGNMSGQTLHQIEYPAERIILLPQKPSTDPAWNYEGILFLAPSNLTLPDNGATIEVLDQNDVPLSQMTYPTTKKGSQAGVKYAEVWHQDDSGEIFPLRVNERDYIEWLQQNFLLDRPTLPENVDIRISELALNGGDTADFIELLVVSAPANGANIKDLRVTHTGTEILSITQDYWVQKGDLIVIQFGDKPLLMPQKNSLHVFIGSGKNSLAQSNGTVTVRLWAQTSWEEIQDFWCWVKPGDNPSRTMQSRIETAGKSVSDCFLLATDLPEQASWAQDFSLIADQPWSPKIQYLGSAGQPNYWPNPKNLAPQPRIEIQTITTQSINLSAANSTDPNGDFDLDRTEWRLIQKNLRGEKTETVLADTLNPSTFTLASVLALDETACLGLDLSLRVTIYDYHQARGQKDLRLPLAWRDEKCSLLPPKREPKKIIPRQFLPPANETEHPEDFFAEIAAVLTENYSYYPLDYYPSAPAEESSALADLVTARDKFWVQYPMLTPAVLQKNIGWALYLGR